MSYYGSYDTGASQLTPIFIFVSIILIVTLGLVVWDFKTGWGWLRKAYPGELCYANEECLTGLKCSNNSCSC